jgi:hypothetical protein
MTICIGINFGEYVILCADTRKTFGEPRQRWVDDCEKVVETALGLITGAGWTTLLDAVGPRFGEVHVVADIGRIVNEERDAILQDRRFLASNVRRWLGMTGWLFTYRSPTHLRLGLLHPHFEQDHGAGSIVSIEPGHGRVICPAEATSEEADVLFKALNDHIRPVGDFDDLQAHYRHHYDVCAGLVAAASRYPSVAPRMTIGVHTVSGQIDVSSPVDLDGRNRDDRL